MVDEVGIETGCLGKFRIRSSYQPVFERAGLELHKTAMQGSVAPFTAGRQVPDSEWQIDEPGFDAYRLELLRLVLQVRNYRNAGADGLALHLALDQLIQLDRSRSAGAIAGLVHHMNDAELDADCVVCTLSSYTAESLGNDWHELIAELRGHRLGVAIGDFGSSHWTEASIAEIGPAVIRVEHEWFAQVCRHDATMRLFATVVRRLQDQGARMLVGKIDTREKLSIALRAGVDLFEGVMLAPANLVGTAIGEQPLHLGDMLDQTYAILPQSL